MKQHSLKSATSVAGNVATAFTFTTQKLHKALYGQVVLTTDATVANRRVTVAILDEDGNTIVDVHAGAVVAASATSQHHEFMQGVYRETSFVGSALQVPFPQDAIIPANGSLKVSIENGVAGDSYDAKFMTIEAY